ncbi:phage tail tape measure protein [Moraxella nonliquefaciens]|uniref:phage tail tape measure protein n=1 Tax=Moraxella nonliquefaciens TaxID=478 RepID=UPI0024A64F2F|nr:phage tail tape measure protein [Moraxella nonliquefaciens]MDI4500826.1 phage tail tape measure protein [Moraxella nonliquefaciens]
MANQLQTQLTIKTGVEGVNKISELSKEIAKAGVDVTGLTQASSELAKEFSSVQSQQALIDNFVRLKTESRDNSKAINEARIATATLSNEHANAKEKVKALESAITESGKATKEQKQQLAQAKKEASELQKSFERSVGETQRLTAQQESLTSQIGKVKSAMNEAGLSTKNLYQQKQALSARAKEAEQSLGSLTNEAKRLKTISDAKIALGIDTDDKARAELDRVHKAYERLKLSGKLTGSELARASELHTKKVKELEEQLGKTTLTASEMIGELSKIAGSAGGMAVVAKAAMEFETAMAGVKKVVDGTPEQMSRLSKEIKDLSVELGMTATEVAQIATMGGQLGVPIDKLGEFTTMAGQMAVAFGMSAEEAGNAAAKLANVFNMPIEQVGELGDVINTLGNNMAAKEREIVDAMLRVGGTARQFGLAKEEVAGLTAAMIALGKPPEVASTAINALLTKLQTAQNQGAGFADGLKMIGTSADEMADNIAQNPQEALSGFLEKLGQLDDRQRSMVSVKLFGAEYADDINLLVGSLGTYNQALGLATDKTATAGAMQKEFQAQMDTAAKKVTQAKAELMALAINIGQHLLPIIGATAEAVGDMAGTLADIAHEYPTITQLVTLMGGAVVAVKALNSVIALTGGLGSKSALQITTGFLGAKSAIDATAVSAGKMNTELGNAGVQTASLAKQMTSLNGIMGALTAWTVGKSIGDWAYENSSTVRAIGDEMGRLLAYADAIFTDRTFDDVRQNFETSAESAKRLADETANAKTATDNLAQSQDDATNSTLAQSQANTELINSLAIAKAELEQLEIQLANMGMAGQKNTQDYKDLQTQIEATKTTIKNLTDEAQNQGLGEAIKSDLEKASGAFDALGLDMDEFATGIDSKTKSALQGFSAVMSLAGDDVNKMAMAYNAVKAQVGDNAKAQTELNGRLLEAVNGNKELATAVKDTATAQQNAKKATDEQAKALDALGVSMSAINAGMSKSGKDMADNLKIGLSVIKDTAKGADELKVALTQALDTALASTKTKEDFKAVQTELQKAGLTAFVSSEQMRQLHAGATGTAEGVKELKDKLKEQSETLTNNDKALIQSATATKKLGDAQKETAKNADEMAKASAKASTTTQSSSKGFAQGMAKIAQGIRSQADVLTSLGATHEQINQVFDKMGKDIGKSKRGLSQLGAYFTELDNQTKNMVKSMTDMDSAVTDATESLSSQAVSMADLQKAQNTLARATSFSIEGIVKLDKAKLNNLKEQISQAQKQMDSLADTAKTTMQDLDAELASLQGREMDSQRIKQAQKLADLQAKMAEAVVRGNTEEINHYSKALSLQRQINDEQNRQATNKANEQNLKAWQGDSSNNTVNLTAQDVANGWNARLEAVREQSKREAKQEFAKELMDASKRQAY